MPKIAIFDAKCTNLVTLAESGFQCYQITALPDMNFFFFKYWCFLAFFWKFLETNMPFLSGKTVGHTSVLPDRSVTRHVHFFSNIGNFGFFSKCQGGNVPFLSGNAVGHTSVLPDRSITRHEHFLSNIGDFLLFLKLFFLKMCSFCLVTLHSILRLL